MLTSSDEMNINDALYKSLNALDIYESEEVEFVDGTEEMGEGISGTLRLTSAVLDKETADKIIVELGLPASSLIRVEVEPAIKVIEVVQDEDSGDWRLADEDIINYTISGFAENLCVLSKPNDGDADSEAGYDSMEWERHSLAAPFTCESIIAYLDGNLHDDITLPLVTAFLDYHNN